MAPAAPTLLRRSVSALATYAERDLSALWRDLDTPERARTALMDTLPALVITYGEAATMIAADWYDDTREKAEARRRFAATPVPASDRGAQALAGWAVSTAVDVSSLQTLVSGGVQRRIADHLRMTITENSIKDPSAQGWVRVGNGECDWCSQFLTGDVYHVEGYDFPAHDHCNCTAVPAF